MQDLVFLALVIAFFAIATGVVALCDRIVRSAEVPLDVGAEQDARAEEMAR